MPTGHPRSSLHYNHMGQLFVSMTSIYTDSLFTALMTCLITTTSMVLYQVVKYRPSGLSESVDGLRSDATRIADIVRSIRHHVPLIAFMPSAAATLWFLWLRTGPTMLTTERPFELFFLAMTTFVISGNSTMRILPRLAAFTLKLRFRLSERSILISQEQHAEIVALLEQEVLPVPKPSSQFGKINGAKGGQSKASKRKAHGLRQEAESKAFSLGQAMGALFDIPLITLLILVVTRPAMARAWRNSFRGLKLLLLPITIASATIVIVAATNSLYAAIVNRNPFALILATMNLLLFICAAWLGSVLMPFLFQGAIKEETVLKSILADNGLLKRLERQQTRFVVAAVVVVTLGAILGDFKVLTDYHLSIPAFGLLGGWMNLLPMYLTRKPDVLLLTTSTPHNLAWAGELALARSDGRIVSLLNSQHIERDSALQEVVLADTFRIAAGDWKSRVTTLAKETKLILLDGTSLSSDLLEEFKIITNNNLLAKVLLAVEDNGHSILLQEAHRLGLVTEGFRVAKIPRPEISSRLNSLIHSNK